MAVDYDARVLAEADSGPGEMAVVAPNDLAAPRAERQHGLGHDMRWHVGIETPGRLREPRYPAVSKGDRPSAQESIRRRIRIGRKSGGP